MWLVCNCICCAISGIGIGILYMVSWRRRKLLWLSFSGCFTGSSIAYNLKVLTKFFFFRIQFFIPNWCPKYVLWFFFIEIKDFEKWLQNFFCAFTYYSALPPFPADWIPSVASAFSAQLFGHNTFSGFGHCGSLVLSAILPRFYNPQCKVKFTKRTGEPR